MITMKINGGKELHDLLQKLPVEIETKIMRNAMAKGAKVIQAEAKALVPVKTGLLRKAIKTTRDTKRGQVIAKVKIKGKHSYLARFIEYGVAPHLIAATGKGEGRVAVRKADEGRGTITNGVMKIGDDFVSGIIQHPGHAAKPFLRPALDTKAAEAINVIGQYIAQYVKLGTIQAPTISVDEEGG